MHDPTTIESSTQHAPPAEPGEQAEDAAGLESGEDRPRSNAMGHLALLLVSLAVLALSFVLSIRDETKVIVPVVNAALPDMCTFKRSLRIDCPGCGLTRCFISLAHGEVGRAWRFNPAGLLFFAVVASQVPFRTAQIWRLKRGMQEFTLPPLAMWVLVALAASLIVQWAVKLALLFVQVAA